MEDEKRSQAGRPLSFAQERLWFINQLLPDCPAYRIPAAWRLRGSLNLAALEQALSTLMKRHEMLSMTFALVQGQPVQKTALNTTVHLTVEDWRALPPEQHDAIFGERLRAAIRHPFDLAQGPLWRALLFQSEDEEYRLLVVFHQLIADDWSVKAFEREMAALYATHIQGDIAALSQPILPFQFTNYAIWQRQKLQGRALDSLLSYWRQQLETAPKTLELPGDNARPAAQTFWSASHTFRLPTSLLQDIQLLSQQEGATLFLTLLAAFQVLLFRYTGQENLLVGTPTSERQAEGEDSIGPFANTLVLRADLSGNPTFRALLARVREICIDAFAHQDLPFAQLVEAMQLERDLSRNPLVQIMFAFQSASLRSTTARKMGELEMMPIFVERGTTTSDLSLELREEVDGFVGVIEYNRDLFSQETITRLAEHYCVLLKGIVADPTQQLSDLPILSDDERQQLLIEWNVTQAECPVMPLHQLFEAQVEQTPEALALVCAGEQLTYDELNRRANQVAHFLQMQGVRPEIPVGLLFERSSDLVIGMLGILKAGGAYVPLDPAYPQERLAFTLQNSRAPVLLTQQRLLPCLLESARQACTIVCLDTDSASISKQRQENMQRGPSPANLAYIIYTSGSTGQPKGVAITHQSAAILVHWASELFGTEDMAGVLASTSICFDLSVFELFAPLSCGGKIILAENALQLPEIARTEQVTLVNTVPSVMAELMRSGGLPASVRTVNLAGEALHRHLVDQIYACPTVRRVFNLYGPTEDTTYSTWALVEHEEGTPVPIGRPLPNTGIYLLDKNMQPVPIGVPGELYLGGKGLARGYVHRLDLTAERFVPDPFSTLPGARLYRTGDLARYRSNGYIDYLGRIDNQVKVRGFRIEPGEIEAALARHAGVRECLVLAREDRPGDKRLIAYLVPSAQQERPTAMSLRHHLQTLLPEYMIPAAFIWLNNMPLTANGKIDRAALPTPGQSRPEQEEAFVAPATQIEATLASIWTEVLDIDQAGVLDNFFALGGDSIRSVRVLTLLKQRGLSCSLQQIFQFQTIRELAQILVPKKPASLGASDQPFALVDAHDLQKLPADLEDAYPATKLQLGMLFHSGYEYDSTLYHNVMSLHLRARFDQPSLEKALQFLVACHPVLRTSFDVSTYSEPLQLVHRTASVPLGSDDLRHVPAEDQEKIILAWLEAETNRKYDWTVAPLLRFHVHRRSEDTFQLTLANHHALLDGWSIAALLTEMLREYVTWQGGQRHGDETLPATGFRDFVALERATIASEQARRYWQEKLREPHVMKFPRRRAHHPTTTSQQRREIKTVLSPDVLQGLRRLARQANVPFKSVLLAAHLRVMSVMSGETDILTGLASSGRPESEGSERALGVFLNSMPFRQKLSGGSWIELVLETFKNEQESLPFRRYPLAQIQLEHGGQPLFETLFNYTHFHVYQELRSLPLEMLGIYEFGEIDFALTVTFDHDIVTSELRLILQYNPAAFSEAQMQAAIGYYTTALTRMAQEPTGRYEAQALLSPAERRQVLLDWNNTATDYPHDHCIHHLFELQVELTPEAVAVAFEDQSLTYQALHMRANQLAHYLQQRGVGPEVCVGLCLERSLNLVIALLAILKAGGVYVPLDPHYPQERLAFMLADARVSVLLTQTSLRAQLPPTDAALVCLDQDWPQIAQQPTTNPDHRAVAENLAYIIYTSGSTGQPKGVCVTHQAVVRLVKATSYAQFTASERFLQFAPISFDAATFELWGSLLNGAALVVPPPSDLTLDELGKVLERAQVTTLWLTAGLFHLMVEEHLDGLAHLHQLLAGGDVLSVPHVRRVLENLKGCQLINGYGPTESTTFACCYPVTDPAQLDETVPIGRPIANTQVYVLDTHLQPVPVGVPGELFIRGAGLARGYLNRPELTAERFIPHPFSKQPGARLYKTGDLVRYRPDGSIEFLGRKDQQVKIRGFRVELGEIETMLGQHPEVQEAIVQVREQRPGDKRLVAYVLPRQQPGPSSRDLLSFLKKHFPEYMVPAAVVKLDSLPLTPNGKVDYQALPEPEWTGAELTDTYEAPRTPVEEVLAAIWAELFKVPRVGINDNFFELGGHSLLAMQVITRVRNTLGFNPPLRILFEAPTIARLAEALAAYKTAPGQYRVSARLRQRISKA